jgi:hypothetical protein
MQAVIPCKVHSWKPDLPEGAGDGLSVGDMQHKGEASTNRGMSGVGTRANECLAFGESADSGAIYI